MEKIFCICQNDRATEELLKVEEKFGTYVDALAALAKYRNNANTVYTLEVWTYETDIWLNGKILAIGQN